MSGLEWRWVHVYWIQVGPVGPHCGRGPYSRGMYSETRIVGAAIGELLDMGFSASEIRIEFTIQPGSRVDIAIPEVAQPLLFECKVGRLTRRHLSQAERYLAAARGRWPQADPIVYLVGEEIGPKLVEPDGVRFVTVRAA